MDWYGYGLTESSSEYLDNLESFESPYLFYFCLYK